MQAELMKMISNQDILKGAASLELLYSWNLFPIIFEIPNNTSYKKDYQLINNLIKKERRRFNYEYISI